MKPDLDVKPSVEKATELVQLDKREDAIDPEVGVQSTKEQRQSVSVPYRSLFRYADARDKFYITVGTICAILNGASLPLMSIIIGELVNTFTKLDIAVQAKNTQSNLPLSIYEDAKNKFNTDLRNSLYNFIWLAAGSFLVAYLQMALWQLAAESQSRKIKEHFFRALLRQEMGWFDQQKRGELTTRMTGDVQVIRDGIGDKVSLTVQYLSTFIVAYIVAFSKGPLLAAILMISLPFLVGSTALSGKLMMGIISRTQAAYAKSGALAEEILAAIRTVVSFTGEPKHVKDYRETLESAARSETKKGYLSGLGTALIFFVMFATYSLAFWWGGKLIADGTVDVGTLVNVLVAYIIGSFSLGNASPNIYAFISASVAGHRVFSIIERQSKIDSLSKTGDTPSTVTGRIEFRNVDFAYPIRTDIPILKKFSLTIEEGKTVALVGASGSGKSTTVALLERYYTPLGGEVLLDRRNIAELNINWLRNQIGYVGQEPVLFDGSIRQNIAWGRSDSDPTEAELLQALKDANAYDFVMKLPDKLDSLVGERGTLLSGGQKQRIAIARMLIRNPAIVLLDEATSALDTESEGIVQDALNRAAEGRTTIIIAHRLSTVRNADQIVVMKKGEIVEIGKHAELIAKRGYYYDLVHDQQIEVPDNDDPIDGVPDNQVKEKSASIEERPSGAHLSPEQYESTYKEPEVAEEKNLFKRTFKYAWPEKWIVFVGTLSALLAGATIPTYGAVYSQAINDFGLAYTIDQTTGRRVPDPDKLRDVGVRYSVYFLIIAIVAAVSNYLQVTCFTKSGEKITMRMRIASFAALLKQEIGFFDKTENAVGALGGKLATQAGLVKGLIGDTLGTILQVSTGIFVAYIISLVSGWRLALVVIACSPAIMFAGMLQSRAVRGFSTKTEAAYASSGQLASEAISNVRTVIAFGLQHKLIDEYHQKMETPFLLSRKAALLSSILFGFSQCAMYLVYAIAFAYAGSLVASETYRFETIFRVVMTVIFASSLGGRLAAFIPDYSKAREAAIDIYKLLDRPSLIDSSNTKGQPMSVVTQGGITFENVYFRYPTRIKSMVHRGLNFEVQPGQKVALVGSSGCGKSTVIQLLERFYDPEMGLIKIDGVNIKDLNIKTLRSMLSLVGQEPTLFDGTILQNIKYGAVDPLAATDEEAYEVAKKADVHDFITSLPHGYSTIVGEKGTLLSGGQKQRVAIARALMRNPRILLLDEATSALDAESEHVVQQALDNASKGRTTLIIAHRLSTVQNADVIFVLKEGRVVEQGTHRQLINNKNHYYNLVMHQMEAKS